MVVCWRLDRLGRNLQHLLAVLQELQALGVSFISSNEGLDATTPAGRLQMHLLAAFAQNSSAPGFRSVCAPGSRALADKESGWGDHHAGSPRAS